MRLLRQRVFYEECIYIKSNARGNKLVIPSMAKNFRMRDDIRSDLGILLRC